MIYLGQSLNQMWMYTAVTFTYRGEQTAVPQGALGEFEIRYQEKSHHRKDCQSLGQAAHGRGGITILGSVQRRRGCGVGLG